MIADAVRTAFAIGRREKNLLRHYQDGVLTDQPLRPWPMNQRIADAMKSAGYAPVDVTATVEGLLEPIR